MISSYGFSWSGYAFIPFCPLILAHALPSISKLVMAQDLKMPGSGGKYCLSAVLFVFGHTLGLIGYWKETSNGKTFEDKFVKEILVIYILPFFS